MRDILLAVATAETNSIILKKNHWMLHKPTNYISIGVSVGRGYRAQ